MAKVVVVGFFYIYSRCLVVEDGPGANTESSGGTVYSFMKMKEGSTDITL